MGTDAPASAVACVLFMSGSIVTQRGTPDHEGEPRPDPDRGRPPPVQDQGRPRWSGARRGRSLGAMTTTPPEAPSGPPPPDPNRDTGPRVDRDQVRDLGRLRRSTTDRKVAGVAGGLGRHLDVDP